MKAPSMIPRFAMLGLFIASAAAQTNNRSVALTFDDLPFVDAAYSGPRHELRTSSSGVELAVSGVLRALISAMGGKRPE